MATQSQSFTAAGKGNAFTVQPGQSATYDLSGTFSGSAQFEKSVNSGASWERYSAVLTSAGNGSIRNESTSELRVRWRCIARASGTLVTVIADVSDTVQEIRHPVTGEVLLRFTDAGVEIPGTLAVTGATTFTGVSSPANLTPTILVVRGEASPTQTAEGSIVWDSDDDVLTVGDGASRKTMVDLTTAQTLAGPKTLTSPIINDPVTTSGVGAKNGATVSVVERGGGAVHKSILTLAATPITLTDDPGAGQYGGVKLYDFPAGNIVAMGAVVDVDLTLTNTFWTDAAEGDVGLGTTVVTNGDALATTEQNIVATTPIPALVAQVGAANARSSAGATIDGTGSDPDLYLNFRIDDSAAHMPGLVTNGAFSADTNWTKGTGWTIAAGVATSDGSQVAVSELSGVVSLGNGVTYVVAFALVRTAGTVTPVLGGTAGTARSTDATHTENIVAGADNTIILRASADFEGTVDNVIVTSLTGTGTISGTVTVVWANAGDF